MRSEDLKLVLDFTGWEVFDPQNWNCIMSLIEKIEETRPESHIWAVISPMETKITVEYRDASGEMERASNGAYKEPAIFRAYRMAGGSKERKYYAMEVCLKFLKAYVSLT